MSGLLYLPVFVLGCVMLVLGAAGVAHVGRSRARRRHLIVFSLDELLGRDMRALRRKETRVEIASRAAIVAGAVVAIVAYIRL